MNQPALVLADEPTGNLDRENADQAFALMTEIQRETGTTFLLSTHDRELAERCERRIYIQGGVVVDAPTSASTSNASATSARQPLRMLPGEAVAVVDRTAIVARDDGDRRLA